jgi:hypothetical protein
MAVMLKNSATQQVVMTYLILNGLKWSLSFFG